MKSETIQNVMKDTTYGLIGGIAGTLVMDKVTTYLYESESDETKRKESSLMKEPAYAILARRMAKKTGFHLTEQQISKAGELFHWALGTCWGGLFGALHDRIPAISKARGLFYGIMIFALGDEGLNTALKISPPPREFPLAVHLRGLIGHIVYAATVDGAFRLREKAAKL